MEKILTTSLHMRDHSRPQSPSFLGQVVGYKLRRVALGTRMKLGRIGVATVAYYSVAFDPAKTRFLLLVGHLLNYYIYFFK